MQCGAPRVAVGDDPRDGNPVTSIVVNYVPENYAWRVNHYFRDGSAVSRNNQYALRDTSNDRKTQWAGTSTASR